jgi:hypothetical protein
MLEVCDVGRLDDAAAEEEVEEGRCARPFTATS